MGPRVQGSVSLLLTQNRAVSRGKPRDTSHVGGSLMLTHAFQLLNEYFLISPCWFERDSITTGFFPGDLRKWKFTCDSKNRGPPPVNSFTFELGKSSDP